MFSNFDFDVIIRSLPYLFYDGMTFTLMLTALATTGGIVLGTVLALMRLSGFAPLSRSMGPMLREQPRKGGLDLWFPPSRHRISDRKKDSRPRL